MVFVLDKTKSPLMPCTEKRARLLLKRGRAIVHRASPFTIRLNDRLATESELQPLRLKLDPGSKATGFAVLRESSGKGVAVLLGEIRHKPGIKDSLDDRRALRRGRRNRKTRYRKPRFLNRRRPEGWLPPSLKARVEQILSAVAKLRAFLPVAAISTEHVKFDTQLLQNPEINGVEYQRGTLFEYEVKEYLLEKWNRKCAYCGGLSGDPVLNVEHVVPKNPAHGPKGTDRISNLTLACEECNLAKSNKQPKEWLTELQASGNAKDRVRAENLPKVLKQLKQPLYDAAMLNATRWRLYNRLKETRLPVECGTGALTKFNRVQKGLSKTHYYDACCVGRSTLEKLIIPVNYVLVWSVLGRGRRQMALLDRYGFPRGHRSRRKVHFGFRTGDLVRAEIPRGRYSGTQIGRVAVRASGSFDFKDGAGHRIAQGISWKHCRLLQRGDGWQYSQDKTA